MKTAMERVLELENDKDCLLNALAWLENYFRVNIDGGGNHACPWCYHRKDEQQPWSEVSHTPDCVIGKALAPSPAPQPDTQDRGEELPTGGGVGDALDLRQPDEGRHVPSIATSGTEPTTEESSVLQNLAAGLDKQSAVVIEESSATQCTHVWGLTTGNQTCCTKCGLVPQVKESLSAERTWKARFDEIHEALKMDDSTVSEVIEKAYWLRTSHDGYVEKLNAAESQISTLTAELAALRSKADVTKEELEWLLKMARNSHLSISLAEGQLYGAIRTKNPNPLDVPQQSTS